MSDRSCHVYFDGKLLGVGFLPKLSPSQVFRRSCPTENVTFDVVKGSCPIDVVSRHPRGGGELNTVTIVETTKGSIK